jgi:hypothetical protein
MHPSGRLTTAVSNYLIYYALIHQQFGHSRDFSNCAEEVDSKDDDDVTGISSR